MRVAGNEQYWLLTSLRALTALSRRVALCALPHEGGRNPCPPLALNSLFALHVHIKRVKKPGSKWRRKKGCSPRNGRSCCVPSGQTREGFATRRGNKAKLRSLLPAAATMGTAILWLNRTTLTTCGYFHCYHKKLFCFLKRKHLWVLSWGLWLKLCKRFAYCGTQIPQETSAPKLGNTKPSETFGVGSCRTGRALLKSVLKEQST